jgi:hypothetical protein
VTPRSSDSCEPYYWRCSGFCQCLGAALEFRKESEPDGVKANSNSSNTISQHHGTDGDLSMTTSA